MHKAIKRQTEKQNTKGFSKGVSVWKETEGITSISSTKTEVNLWGFFLWFGKKRDTYSHTIKI